MTTNFVTLYNQEGCDFEERLEPTERFHASTQGANDKFQMHLQKDRVPGRLSAVGMLFEQGEQDQDWDDQAGYNGLKATSREEVGVGGRGVKEGVGGVLAIQLMKERKQGLTSSGTGARSPISRSRTG